MLVTRLGQCAEIFDALTAQTTRELFCHAQGARVPLPSVHVAVLRGRCGTVQAAAVVVAPRVSLSGRAADGAMETVLLLAVNASGRGLGRELLAQLLLAARARGRAGLAIVAVPWHRYWRDKLRLQTADAADAARKLGVFSPWSLHDLALFVLRELPPFVPPPLSPPPPLTGGCSADCAVAISARPSTLRRPKSRRCL